MQPPVFVDLLLARLVSLKPENSTYHMSQIRGSLRMARISLILLVAVLTGSLPASSFAADISDFKGPLGSLLERQKERAKQRQEVRQERNDARQEVLFWFRTHPQECLLPQAVVDKMVQSGGYRLEIVKELVGTRNPFFEEFRWSPEFIEMMKKSDPDFEDHSSPCDPEE